MPVPRASAIAARLPAVHAVCTVNLDWRAPSCARLPIAVRFQACRRRVGEARTMSMTDPIADLLTRIRNAQSAGKPTVGVGASKLKLAILKALKDEGYIAGYGADGAGAKNALSIELEYHHGHPVLDRIERISRPGLRIYRGKHELPNVLGGLGVAVISTPKGIMSDAQARAAGTGGEVLFVVQ